MALGSILGMNLGSQSAPKTQANRSRFSDGFLKEKRSPGGTVLRVQLGLEKRLKNHRKMHGKKHQISVADWARLATQKDSQKVSDFLIDFETCKSRPGGGVTLIRLLRSPPGGGPGEG